MTPPPSFAEIPAHLQDLSVAESWERVDKWLADHRPELANLLAGPASDDDIAQLEDALGVELPADYKSSLRIHAGGVVKTSRSGGIYAESPFYDFQLLPPAVLIETHRYLRQYADFPVDPRAEVSETVRHVYYDTGWIPVVAADEDNAVFYCIDTVPTAAEAYGQIVQVITKADPDRLALWPSFREVLIEGLVMPLDQGAIDEEALDADSIVRFRV